MLSQPQNIARTLPLGKLFMRKFSSASLNCLRDPEECVQYSPSIATKTAAIGKMDKILVPYCDTPSVCSPIRNLTRDSIETRDRWYKLHADLTQSLEQLGSDGYMEQAAPPFFST